MQVAPLAAPWLRAATLALLVCSAPGRAADLTAYTTEWRPYNYEEGSEARGVATEILRAVCAEAALSCDIRFVPWARAYATVSETPNTLLFTTARIPAREAEFLWVGPILPRVTWVYGLAGSEARIRSFEDLAKHKVGVIRGEAPIRDLEARGVPTSAMAVESSNALVLKQLVRGGVEAMVDTELGMAWNLRQADLPASTVAKLMKLSDQGGYHFALNLATDPALHARMQAALDRARQSGEVARIVARYR